MKKVALLSLLLTFILSACDVDAIIERRKQNYKVDEEGLNGVNGWVDPNGLNSPEAWELTEAEKEQVPQCPNYEIIKDEFVDINMTNVKFKARIFRVKYESSNADRSGKTWVSGSITVPNDTTPSCMVFFNHSTKDYGWAADDNTQPDELRSSGFIFVSADYLGYGVSENEDHPYLHHKQNAENVVDLGLVARDIMKKNNIECKFPHSFGLGYSQGGGVTLALHKYMEQNLVLRKYFRYSASFCGAGPYDTEKFMDYLISDMPDNKPMSYPIALPFPIKGMMASFPKIFEEIEFKDYFSEPLQEKIEEMTKETHKHSRTGNVMSYMKEKFPEADKQNPAHFLSEEVLKKEGKLYDALKQALAKEEVSLVKGWKATFPIYLYHSKGDTFVPYFNAESALKNIAPEGNENYRVVTLETLSNENWDHTDQAAISEMANKIVKTIPRLVLR